MQKTCICAVLLLIAGIGVCVFPEHPEKPDQPNDTPDFREWLQSNAIPFKTTEPESGFDDLMPLKEIIGDARIVALGEATHGTHEFFEMKHRIVEFLVKEMGFNIFAIEANWPECNAINEYIHTGNGDPEELLHALRLWPWRTQEVLNMIEWMREHNENPGSAPSVSFFGFDMQSSMLARINVAHYLQKVDPEKNYLKEINSLLRCSGKDFQEVYDYLKSHQSTYEAASSPEEFAFALQSARVCAQTADLEKGGFWARDQYMAENAAWLLTQGGPDAKIILWAHNGHVGIDAVYWKGISPYMGSITYLTRISIYPKSMGTYLRYQYRDDMVVFGFMFHHGSFNAGGYEYRGIRAHHVGAPPEDSYEYHFASAGLPRFFLDLREVEFSPVAEWMLEPHPFRTIGSLYSDSYSLSFFFYDYALSTMFDVVIYFEDTTPSTLL